MRQTRLMYLTSVLAVVMFGCASIVSKSQYPVTISSVPDAATVTIENKAGEQVFRGETPTTVTLNASAGFFSGENYTIHFEKAGYSTATRMLNSEMDGWYIGNILLGGVIGMLIVDPATGAMWKLPENISANLDDTGDSSIMQKSQFKVATIDDIPAEYRQYLIPLGDR